MPPDPSDELLRQVAWMARTGRFDAAAAELERGLAGRAGTTALWALGGAIECQRGAFDRAVPYLRRALIDRPTDPVIRANLADALFRSGDVAAARRLCDETSARADASLRLARLGGHLAQEDGDDALAARLYRLVLAADDADWVTWNNLGNALKSLGEFADAVTALSTAVRLAPDAAPIRMNLGEALLTAGRGEEGIAVLRQAATDFPQDPHPFLTLFRYYGEIGLEEKSYEALRDAASRGHDRADIQADFGHVAGYRNEFAVSEQAMTRALEIDPGLAAGFVGLAAIYERTNRADALDALQARAQQTQIDPAAVAFIETLRLRRDGAFEAALATLDRAEGAVIVSRWWQLRGQLLDRLGRIDEAFAAFTRMNAAWLDHPSDPRHHAAVYRAGIAAATDLITSAWYADWRPAPIDDGRSGPVFLVGFPRSGTTLLDTMLMAVPQVRVLEEEPFISDLETELGGIGALADLSAEQILAARARYFARVEAVTDVGPNIVLVDKHPMHLARVPTILRLFPDARFILALRHPCDAILSCFMTNFRLNTAMSSFLDLDDAAALYDAVFTQWEQARTVMDPPVAEVVYERLVADVPGELMPLFERLGLPWPDGDFDHRAAAQARGTVRTASYSQVTEPIYRRAAGRWHRYRSHIAGVLPQLASWAERFGYEIDPEPPEPTP